MVQHHDQCTDQNMELALREKRIQDIFHCLKKSFDQYQYRIFGNRPSPETREDVFWIAALKLDKKSKTQKVNLTSSVNAFFRGIVKTTWKEFLSAQKRKPNFGSLKDLPPSADSKESILILMINDETMNAFLQAIEAVKKKDKKFPIILKAFLEGKKDHEIMEELGYSNSRGVSMARKRCFDEIRKYLKANFPDLFNFKF